MKKTLLLCSIIISIVSAMAQNSTLYGRVMDAITFKMLDSVSIEVMTLDSTIVGSTTSGKPWKTGEVMINYYVGIPVGKATYIIKYERKGYYPIYITKSVKGGISSNGIPISDIHIFRKERMLSEVKVTATKVKMVMKGDTIVYDADAFQTAEGSMLDGLIHQLPGVELDRNGQIKVNGEFVSSLLVNGEYFFRGDNNVALQNLPAYMVSKVNVYRKSPDDAYITDKSGKRKTTYPLVMDVRLKKQYSIGFAANAEVGAGTHDRWLARLFGLRFTDHSRLAIFGNVNNINVNSRPGESGEWTPDMQTAGRETNKSAGAEIMINDKHNIYKQTSSVNIDWQGLDRRDETSSQSFLQGGDTYGRNRGISKNGQFKLKSQNEMKWTTAKLFLSLQPKFEYSHHDNKQQYYAAELSDDPVEKYRGAIIDSIYNTNVSSCLKDILLNQSSSISDGKGHKWNANLRTYGTVFTPLLGNDDFMRIYLNGDFTDSKYKSYAQNNYTYTSTTSDFRNQFTDIPFRSYEYWGGADFQHDDDKNNLYFLYTYKQTYKSDIRQLYRLDMYEQWRQSDTPFGTLPSTRDSMLQCLDIQNSFQSASLKRLHNLSLIISRHLAEKINATLRIDANVIDEKLRYHSYMDTIATRSAALLTPEIWLKVGAFNFKYKYGIQQPDLIRTIDVTDNSNPLIIQQGNAGLRNTIEHKIQMSFFDLAEKHNRRISAVLFAYFYDNNLATGMTYDKVTGARTYKPQNVDGNWNLDMRFEYGQTIDKKGAWRLDAATRAYYINSVDLVTIANQTQSTRSTVHNVRLTQNFDVKYSQKSSTIGAVANAAWTNQTSRREDFTTINCLDFKYGVTALLPLLWKLQFSTDMTMYSRRGYNDHSMNTNELVWNARLSRTFPKAGLTVMLDAFDILGNLSNISQVLNSQGRTETYRNSLPRYIMAHLIYRLNKRPKNAK